MQARDGSAKAGRFCDPITGDVLTNASRIVLLKTTGGPEELVLRVQPHCCTTDRQDLARRSADEDVLPTGDVMLRATYEKCVKPDGAYGGKKLKEKDVVALHGGAEASVYPCSLQVWHQREKVPLCGP